MRQIFSKKQIYFFTAIVFLIAAGAGLLVYKQYLNYYEEKTANDLEVATNLPVQKPSAPTVLADGRLQVNVPKDGDTVGQTFTISGFAQGWFEGNISIKVFDASNTPLYTGNAIAGDNYTHPAPFSSAITLSATSTTPTGRIEFNDYSAKDGSLVYQKVVYVKFANYEASIDTTGWKIYKNDQYGFELQYPGDWITYDNIYYKGFQSGNYYILQWGIEPPARPAGYNRQPLLTMSVITNPGNLSLPDFFKKIKNQPCEECGYYPYADIQKLETVQTLSGVADIFNVPGVETVKYAYLSKGEFIFELSMPADADYSSIYKKEYLLKIFNKMLTTFKFIHTP